MVERTKRLDDGAAVAIEAPAAVGDHVRPAGDDMAAGDEVFAAGDMVTAGHIGVLASIGRSDVLAVPRPRVGVLSTGDELVEGSEPLQPGQIRDSNRRALLALVAEAGFDAVDLGLIRDDEAAITAAVSAGAASCDALLTSGGVSMGDIDLVKVVLDRIGEMRWMQIAIRPAKPFAFGLVGESAGPGVRAAGQPGLIHGVIRAAGAAGAAVDGRSRPSTPAGSTRGRRRRTGAATRRQAAPGAGHR